MPEDDRLIDELSRALEPPERMPPDDGVRRVREAAIAARPEAGERGHGPWWDLRRPVTVGIAIAAAVALGLIGFGIASVVGDDGPAGKLEYAGPVFAPDGEAAGELDVRATGIGRVIELQTGELPVLPRGELYEVWFAAPDDTPESPNRISAGTFHPDDDGNTDVQLAAAVDPARFPTVLVTAEPGDGDPAPSGDEVLRVQIPAEDE